MRFSRSHPWSKSQGSYHLVVLDMVVSSPTVGHTVFWTLLPYLLATDLGNVTLPPCHRLRQHKPKPINAWYSLGCRDGAGLGI